ncbi:protein kinase domain-containing protein [Yinghuangia aomiensis]
MHRDLKPSNILLLDDGPRVIDFGISKAMEDGGGSALTSTGMVVGTPGFMSPEQALGAAVGPASDIFSLASVLVFAATGNRRSGTAPRMHCCSASCMRRHGSTGFRRGLSRRSPSACRRPRRNARRRTRSGPC